MPKINDLTNRPGGPQPTDEIWLASAGAAADFKTNFDAILAFIASTLSGSELNLPVVAVTQQGSVSNHGWNRLQITGHRVETGVYQLSAPPGMTILTLALSNEGTALTGGVIPLVENLGTQTVTIRWFSTAGSLGHATFRAIVVIT